MEFNRGILEGSRECGQLKPKTYLLMSPKSTSAYGWLSNSGNIIRS